MADIGCMRREHPDVETDTAAWWAQQLLKAVPDLDRTDLDALAKACAKATRKHFGEPREVARLLYQTFTPLRTAGHPELAGDVYRISGRYVGFAEKADRAAERRRSI